MSASFGVLVILVVWLIMIISYGIWCAWLLRSVVRRAVSLVISVIKLLCSAVVVATCFCMCGSYCVQVQSLVVEFDSRSAIFRFVGECSVVSCPTIQWVIAVLRFGGVATFNGFLRRSATRGMSCRTPAAAIIAPVWVRSQDGWRPRSSCMVNVLVALMSCFYNWVLGCVVTFSIVVGLGYRSCCVLVFLVRLVVMVCWVVVVRSWKVLIVCC